jgi:hypothetical protein
VQRMATKKTTPTKKRRTSARVPLLREVDAIDFQTLCALTYYPSISPVGDGQMPISAAVHWIASEGLKIDYDLLSHIGVTKYYDAAKALFDKIASNKASVVGENEDEKNDFIPCAEFVELKAYFDFGDSDLEAVAGNDKRLELNVSENKKSRDIFRKSNNRGKWTKIYVFCEEILSAFPFVVGSPAQPRGNKRPKILKYFAQNFSESPGVPDPSYKSRKDLRADLLKWDPKLAPLDEQTVKTAVDKYNARFKST